MEIASQRVEGGLGDGKVLFWADLRRQALAQDHLSKNLSCDGNAECHPCKLEAISENVEVPGNKDKQYDREIGNGRGTRIVP